MTSVSPTNILGSIGSLLKVIGLLVSAEMIVAGSVTFSLRASQVMALYRAPVSRYFQFALWAIARAVLDFPEPLGPSIAITTVDIREP